ncbi:GerMN domain-containing protein [Paenibacillus sp. GP183]|uniref:GerMN domain-containing protein n=1 Tax=Paenibacillus sp. GP183 TaxID=1882751 RepID=UPI0008987CA9|nr:GerMN domain-containing protein [Paenibacillus sp. GP183]SEC71055.1 germination protein M [Paenibacillus sp. GP183]
MLHRPWIRIAALTGAIVLLTTGCSLWGSKKANQIDPPQSGTGAEAVSKTVSGTGSGSGSGTGSSSGSGAGSGTVTINMADSQNQMTLFAKDAKGFVAPISLSLPKTQSPARTTLEYMVKGGPVDSLLPSGFEALLPKGTIIKGVNIITEKKLAVVDFSKQFLSYTPGDERKILEAITWTLTGFPAVEKVQLWVEGKVLKEMPVGKTPLDQPIGRTMGINIEKSEDADFGQSTPVTLYFLNQNDPNYKYYVPVTRMVKRTDDVVTTTVQQLIKGPDAKKGLSPVIQPGTEVRSVKKTDNLITIDFSGKLLGSDQKASVDTLQSIVLSLTENTGISKVQIMIDGAVKDASVSRPSHVNPVKL